MPEWDRTDKRIAALNAAVGHGCCGVFHRDTDTERVLENAEIYFAWLDEPDLTPVHLAMMFGAPDPQSTTRKDTAMANFELPVGDSVTVTIEATNKEGQDVPDQIVWTTSDPANLALVADATTLVATLTASAVPTAAVTVTASDALGNTISGVVDTVDGVPTAFKMTFGTPTTPAPAPAP